MNNSISFIIPAYNCEKTVIESINSIVETNFSPNDEIIVVDDASTDNTVKLIQTHFQHIDNLKIIQHQYNRGGGAARNTAVMHSKNELVFCLDSDNILESNSIRPLREYLLSNNLDCVAFQEIKFFMKNPNEITHSWIFNHNIYEFKDFLSDPYVPGASGNYLYTKQSWIKASGYPEFAKALDAWGFGLRQVATGTKISIFPNSYYFHRYGYDSYWVRFIKENNASLTALMIIIPFLNEIINKDIRYLMSEKGRNSWFENIHKRPIKLKNNLSFQCKFNKLSQKIIEELQKLMQFSGYYDQKN